MAIAFCSQGSKKILISKRTLLLTDLVFLPIFNGTAQYSNYSSMIHPKAFILGFYQAYHISGFIPLHYDTHRSWSLHEKRLFQWFEDFWWSSFDIFTNKKCSNFFTILSAISRKKKVLFEGRSQFLKGFTLKL